MDKFRYNAKRASLVQSRIKAIERMAEVHLVETDPEYIFRCGSQLPGRCTPLSLSLSLCVCALGSRPLAMTQDNSVVCACVSAPACTHACAAPVLRSCC